MTAAWGLDIGRRAVKAVRVAAVHDQLELDLVDVVEMKADVESVEDAAVEAFQKTAVRTLFERNEMFEPVHVAIPGHVTFSKVIRAQAANDVALAKTMRFEAQHNIPFPLTDVVWDYHKLGQAGAEAEVSLYAAKRDSVARMLAWLTDMGLDVAGVQIAPIALLNFVRYDLDLRGGNLVLDIGSDNTDLIVADGDRTWIRNMPIAGNTVTHRLQEAFKVSYAEAEQLKRKAAESKDAQKITEVMQPVLKDLASEVERSLDYYRKSVPGAVFEKCLLLGNGMRLVGLREFLQEHLKMGTVKLVRLSRMQYGPRLDMDKVRDLLPGLGVALGLAVQGCGGAGIAVNLLPPEQRAERVLARKRPWYLGAACVALATVGGLWWHADSTQATYGRASTEVTGALKTADDTRARHAAAADTAPLVRTLEAAQELAWQRLVMPALVSALLATAPPENADPAAKDGARAWLLDAQAGWRGGPPLAAGKAGAPVDRALTWQVTGAVLFQRQKAEGFTRAEGEKNSKIVVERQVLPRLRAAHAALADAQFARGFGTRELNPGADGSELGADEMPRFYRFVLEGSVPAAKVRDWARTAAAGGGR